MLLEERLGDLRAPGVVGAEEEDVLHDYLLWGRRQADGATGGALTAAKAID
jgi:hypothetical protein